MRGCGQPGRPLMGHHLAPTKPGSEAGGASPTAALLYFFKLKWMKLTFLL